MGPVHKCCSRSRACALPNSTSAAQRSHKLVRLRSARVPRSCTKSCSCHLPAQRSLSSAISWSGGGSAWIHRSYTKSCSCRLPALMCAARSDQRLSQSGWPVAFGRAMLILSVAAALQKPNLQPGRPSRVDHRASTITCRPGWRLGLCSAAATDSMAMALPKASGHPDTHKQWTGPVLPAEGCSSSSSQLQPLQNSQWWLLGSLPTSADGLAPIETCILRHRRPVHCHMMPVPMLLTA